MNKKKTQILTFFYVAIASIFGYLLGNWMIVISGSNSDPDIAFGLMLFFALAFGFIAYYGLKKRHIL